MVGERLLLNRLTFSGDTPPDIQLVTFLLLSNVSELSIGAKIKMFSKPSPPVRYVLPNKKYYPFVNNILTFFESSINFCSPSASYFLFEVNFLFIFFSLSSKSDFYTKLATSFLLNKSISFNLAVKSSY